MAATRDGNLLLNFAIDLHDRRAPDHRRAKHHLDGDWRASVKITRLNSQGSIGLRR